MSQIISLLVGRIQELDWRYFEQNKVDRNELQIRKSLHNG